jgi:integrase
VAGSRPGFPHDYRHNHERHEPDGTAFQPLLKKAGLLAIRLHDLRHTCATIPLMAGKHPRFVQELLGHASIFITLDTYSHVIEGMDGGLADAMDEAL